MALLGSPSNVEYNTGVMSKYEETGNMLDMKHGAQWICAHQESI